MSLIQKTLSKDDSECVNHSLLLIRNILHVPQRPGNSSDDVEVAASSASQQSATSYAPTSHPDPAQSKSYATADCSQPNQRLLWNLFAQRFDRILINLLAFSQRKVSNF
jgi:timeless protein